MRSALYLVVVLFSVALLFIALHATFLAAVQIIVYAGAIMVLFVFVIMLLNLGTPERVVDHLRPQKWISPHAGPDRRRHPGRRNHVAPAAAGTHTLPKRA